MNKQQILEELLSLLTTQGVKIRRDALGGSGGGICKIKDEYFFFRDTQSSIAETASLCADAVNKLVDTEHIFIKPAVRDFLQTHQTYRKKD